MNNLKFVVFLYNIPYFTEKMSICDDKQLTSRAWLCLQLSSSTFFNMQQLKEIGSTVCTVPRWEVCRNTFIENHQRSQPRVTWNTFDNSGLRMNLEKVSFSDAWRLIWRHVHFSVSMSSWSHRQWCHRQRQWHLIIGKPV